MKNKNKNLFENKRQIELLEKYYVVDNDKKIINIDLHYPKSSDILLNNEGNINCPLFKNEILETVNNLIERTPKDYKVNIIFDIEDYENYKPKQIIESFNDTLELGQYSARRGKQLKNLIASILILVGIILLFFMIIGKNNNWFEEGIKSDIISEVIDIAAWVFIWEAVTMIFLEQPEQNKFALKIRRKVVQITMLKKGNNEPLYLENTNSIFNNWEGESKIKSVGRNCLLISSSAYLFLALFDIYSLCKYLLANDLTIFTIATLIIFTIISSGVSILAGLGGLFKYIGKKNVLANFVRPYAIFLSIIIIINIIINFIDFNYFGLLSIIPSFLINILYIIGYRIDKDIK
ncbi:MAG: hypothetical protein V8R16_09085 [Bacilli bacterium]